MARSQGALKRQRELDRQRKKREKAQKKEQRKLEKQDQETAPPGVDPDIAGIVPGPQPPTEDFLDD